MSVYGRVLDSVCLLPDAFTAGFALGQFSFQPQTDGSNHILHKILPKFKWEEEGEVLGGAHAAFRASLPKSFVPLQDDLLVTGVLWHLKVTSGVGENGF